MEKEILSTCPTLTSHTQFFEWERHLMSYFRHNFLASVVDGSEALPVQSSAAAEGTKSGTVTRAGAAAEEEKAAESKSIVLQDELAFEKVRKPS